MKPIRTFAVIPKLPVRLEALRKLAYNLRWAWNRQTVELFRRLDGDLWEATGHNPVSMLGKIDQSRLQNAANDEAFLGHLDRVSKDLDAYLPGDEAWFARQHGRRDGPHLVEGGIAFGFRDDLIALGLRPGRRGQNLRILDVVRQLDQQAERHALHVESASAGAVCNGSLKVEFDAVARVGDPPGAAFNGRRFKSGRLGLGSDQGTGGEDCGGCGADDCGEGQARARDARHGSSAEHAADAMGQVRSGIAIPTTLRRAPACSTERDKSSRVSE